MAKCAGFRADCRHIHCATAGHCAGRQLLGRRGNAAVAIDSGPCADVLAQERRWLTAITDGNRTTVESILAPGFRHINSDGLLLDRDQEIAGLDGVVHDEPVRSAR